MRPALATLLRRRSARHVLAGLFGVCLSASAADAGYYCSPGFEATYGGRCVATLSRDEIDLYLNDPVGEPARPIAHIRHRHHPRHGLAERY